MATFDVKCWCGGRVDRVVCLESVNHDPFATGRRDKIEVLYIAGPMSGLPLNNYPEFVRVEKMLEAVGFNAINPVNTNPPGRVHYVDLLREDLRVMLDCHGVATLEGWWESSGARNEVQVAGLLKMPVRPWQEWVRRGV